MLLFSVTIFVYLKGTRRSSKRAMVVCVLKVFYLIFRRFVDALLQMVSCRNLTSLEDPAASDWTFALECVDSFNKVRQFVSDFT